MRERLAVLLTLGFVTMGLGAWWMRARPDGPVSEDQLLEADLEDPRAADPALAAAAFAYARGEPRREVLSAPLRRGWLCVFPSGSCAEGTGSDAGEVVASAASRLVMGPADVLTVDWELDRRAAAWPDDAERHSAGTFGIAVGGAVVLPAEVLRRDLYGPPKEEASPVWRHDELRALLAERGANVGATFGFERLVTASWVEAEPPLRTYRLHPYEPVPIDLATVVYRARLAADALAGAVQPDGRIVYRWDVSGGVEQKGQNLLRHAGSTFALLQAWERFRDPAHRDAAERAIGYLLDKTRVDERQGPFGGGTSRWVREGSHVKLGGVGLALLALATWQRTTGDTRWAGEARELATFLLANQRASGEFVYFASQEPGGAPKDDTSAYYPGESVFALGAWYALDPDPRWLDTATRGAAWLVEVRDAGKSIPQLDADHWLMYGLAQLWSLTHEERWLAHGLRLAEVVDHQHRKHQGHERFHRDYAGGFYEPPRATPASVRAEGLAAVIGLCRDAGRPCDQRLPLLRSIVGHAVWAQYVPETSFWMPLPERVIGGVPGGIVDPDLRNDYTQHALSALLATERLLDTAPPDL